MQKILKLVNKSVVALLFCLICLLTTPVVMAGPDGVQGQGSGLPPPDPRVSHGLKLIVMGNYEQFRDAQ